MIKREGNAMAENSYMVWFESAAGGFVVACPALPGLVTEGDTTEEERSCSRH
jgi:predicted RNase H-like HicB family nuclease